MSSDEVHDRVALYAIDALTAEERQEFEEHLSTCLRCREELSDARRVTEALAGSVSAEPPASLRRSVLAAVARTPQEPLVSAPLDSGSGGSHVGAAAPSGEAEVVDIRTRMSRRAAWLVAAAAVLLAAGFGGWAAQSHHEAQQASGRQAQLVSLLGADDVQTVSGAAAGGGSGTVVLSRMRREAVFVSSNLPALPSDRVYELWTLRRQAVPAGTFQPASSGVVVKLPAAALAAHAIAVTVEPAGGSPHPTTPPLVTLPVSRNG